MKNEESTDEGSSDLDVVRRDLVDEWSALDALVRDLSDSDWRRPTSSPGWSVTDQIAHLTFFDASAATAILDPDAFRGGVNELVAAATSEGMDEFTLGGFRELSTKEKLATWRRSRETLAEAAVSLHGASRVPWYGPSMSATSFLDARLMEAWAHGTDVAEALNVERIATDRLRHVARLGFLTRAWSYRVRGEDPPPGDVRLVLNGPTGELWTWGHHDADDTVNGSAQEFCLVVTQRRHVKDTSLVTGDLGYHWLERAQAFAGAASDGPPPRRTT